jgi:hypothetical protein
VEEQDSESVTASETGETETESVTASETGETETEKTIAQRGQLFERAQNLRLTHLHKRRGAELHGRLD